MAEEPKKHHYVPECYQRGFANSRKEFWTRKKLWSKASICTPGKFCYEIDANRFRVKETLLFNNLTDQNYIEKNSFKKQENEFPKNRNSIVRFSESPIIIDKEKYRLFLETLVTIKRRNPETRDFLIKMFRESYDLSDAIATFRKFLLQEFPEAEATDHFIQEYFSKRAKDHDRIYDAYLSTFLQHSENIIAGLTETLYEYQQFILHSPIGSEFITSDNPGFVKEGENILNIGGYKFRSYWGM